MKYAISGLVGVTSEARSEWGGREGTISQSVSSMSRPITNRPISQYRSYVPINLSMR